jgi:predicted RNase H-like nuclease (RuvC/YqgF family)
MKEDQEDIDLTKRIEELDNSLSIALDINDKYQRENNVLKKRAEEAEGEVTIVKGIGQNSPEMKALQKEVEELKSELARSKEDHQYDNLVHQKELESLKNPLHNLRNKGLV